MCLLVQITGLGLLSFEEVYHWHSLFWMFENITSSLIDWLNFIQYHHYYFTVVDITTIVLLSNHQSSCQHGSFDSGHYGTDFWTLWDWLKRQVPSVLHNLHVLAFTKVIAWVDLVNTVYNSFILRSLLCLQATSDQSIILMSTFPSRQSLLKVCLPCEFSI